MGWFKSSVLKNISNEIPEIFFPGITYLVILFLVLSAIALPLPPENKFAIYALSVTFTLGAFIYQYLLRPRLANESKYYFVYLPEIVIISLFLFFTQSFGQLFTFLYFLPIIATSITLSPKYTYWTAGFASISLIILHFLSPPLRPISLHEFFLHNFLNLSSIWLIAAFAYFSAQKVIKEEKAAFYNFRRLVRAQVQTQKAEEFFSVISHELKNSLAVILAHLERILFDKRIVLAPEIIFSLNEAKKATLETNRMIMNVLKTTRLDVGKIKFTPKNIDLSKIILETINHIKPQYEKAGLYLKYNNSNNYPIVSGDPEKIEEICLNLLLNALSFTKNGGVEISHRILSGYLWTVIKDTGTGIPKQNLPHVFKKFTSIRKDKQAGLGLGLYISSEYLKRMGGKIWCDSRQGHGTTFYFRLPIAES